MIESLVGNIKKFTNERKRERDSMMETLENERSGREQELLKEKLSKYTSSAAVATTTISSAPTVDTNITNLADKTREMSIGPNNSSTNPSYYSHQQEQHAAASPITPLSYSTSLQSFAASAPPPPQPKPSYSNAPPAAPLSQSSSYTNYGSHIASQQQYQQQQHSSAPQPLQRAPSYSSNNYANSSVNASPVPYMFSQQQPIPSTPALTRQQDMYVSSPVASASPSSNLYTNNTAPTPPLPLPLPPTSSTTDTYATQQQPPQHRYSIPVYPQQPLPQSSIPQHQQRPQVTPAMPQPQVSQQPPLPPPKQQLQQMPYIPQHQRRQSQQPPPLPSKPLEMQNEQQQQQLPISMASYNPMLSSNVSIRSDPPSMPTPQLPPQGPYYSSGNPLPPSSHQPQQPWQQQGYMLQQPPAPPSQQQQQQPYWRPLDPNSGNNGSLLD